MTSKSPDTALPLPADRLAQVVRRIREADGILVAAGAGMGVDSGLPDFRGETGFWRAYPSLGAKNLHFSDVASPAMFQRDPRLAWGFYGHRLDLYRKTLPHEGFGILRRWADRCANGARVFTSNVDGQFEMAGFDPVDVVECHGSIHGLQCLEPCHNDVWSAKGIDPVVDTRSCQWLGELPQCGVCQGLARPNILMFGDWGWLGDAAQRAQSRLEAWLGGVRQPVVIEIGAGRAIPSVRAFSAAAVRRHGAWVIRINPRDAALDGLPGVSLESGALAALRAIDAAMAGLH